jgi:hypothetical protein
MTPAFLDTQGKGFLGALLDTDSMASDQDVRIFSGLSNDLT